MSTQRDQLRHTGGQRSRNNALTPEAKKRQEEVRRELLRAGSFLYQSVTELPQRLNQHVDDTIRGNYALSSNNRKGLSPGALAKSYPIGFEKDGKRWAGENYGWQSPESFKKLQDGPEFRNGHIGASRLEQSIGNSINGVLGEKGTQALGEVVKAIGNGYEENVPPQLKDVLKAGYNLAADTNGFVSEKTNISPIITGEVLTALGTAGAGQAGSLAVKGGRNSLKAVHKISTNTLSDYVRTLPAQNAYALSIKDQTLIANGIKNGSARSKEWLPQTIEFNRRRAALKEKLQSATSKTGKRNATSDLYNGVSTGYTRDTVGNPHVYGDENFKKLSIIEKKADGTPKWQEQHHLFSKQESYQFVERMIELGDDDDVLNLFIFAEDADATMGGRLKNMLNMERKPHNLAHTSRKRKADGRELQAYEMRNLVESAKTSTELMRLFKKYITENVSLSIDEAKAFNEIAHRMIKADKYGYIEELYEKNMLRKPVWRVY